MKYRKGELSVCLCNSNKGKYCCTFETAKYYYIGFTNDSQICDFFSTHDEDLYWRGMAWTLNHSRELVRWAWRSAYRIAKEGQRIKK